jgi:hypothetical protein
MLVEVVPGIQGYIQTNEDASKRASSFVLMIIVIGKIRNLFCRHPLVGPGIGFVVAEVSI